MGSGRQAAGQMLSDLLRETMSGEFWVYLFAVMCLLIILPCVLLLMVALVKRFVPALPKPAFLPLPEPVASMLIICTGWQWQPLGLAQR